MDRRDAETALRLARQWTREKLMPTSSLAVLEKRHAADAGREGGESFGSSVLYGLGGVLLGAAAFALFFLLMDNGYITSQDGDREAPWIFLTWGLACAAVAFTIDFVAKRPTLGESFHVAALVAVTASAFPRPHDLALGHMAMLYAVGILAYRRQRFMVPFLALVALNVAWTSVMESAFWPLRSEEAAFGAWFVFAIAQMGLLIVATRSTKWPWPATSLGGVTLLVAGSFLAWYFEVIAEQTNGFPGDVEIYLAALMGAVMALGFVLRQKSMVLACALVIAIDAIVFAFDVGDLVGGLLAILAVAGLLIWQAGFLRRYLRES